ncbi:IS630 family transposase [Georgenia sp. TF02-10]|uniref:IS630 family transposase n=1 Tax=Georgenia sp. TF02-10 TaxID=2917725 RepID=UPI001FA76336|nr:IS630 family transposase [Georgenia sp. TF02-10]UNX53211.1 IS630 family transposase [Georgenia sp. TF02-10]UNX53636.1 IS630 family transposase [Georgenia sp. TF02-10]UNX54922.1 IS630 family transposase [Georgenia sp. TF02-10]UNX55500.1 IS630 family transposase [Georgenia sp. TF02-10]UNX55816.1 IS630 family transposase [Georgenia sp. TF02-10]
MTLIELDGTEWSILMKYKEQAPYKLMRLKAEALMLLHENVDIGTVARFVDRRPSTVRAWVRDWQKMRLASVHTGHAENLNASKLTADQRAQVAQILASPPSEQGLPAQFWDVPNLASWLHNHFEVVYESDSSYHFLLHMAGMTFHKPEAVDKRRGDEATIAKRMAEIHQEIAPHLADPDTIVVAADEVRIEHEAILRRAWQMAGTTTRIEVDRQRQAQSYIGFLHQDDGKVDLRRLDWQNSDTIIEALTAFTAAHPKKKIVIVWDNAAWHRSKALRAHLGPGNLLERIHLIHMPPYAPDHNPIEHVWGEAKTSISNIQRATFDQTRTAFEGFIRGNKFPYRLE